MMDIYHELARLLRFSLDEKVAFLTKRNFTIKTVTVTALTGEHFEVYGVFIDTAPYRQPPWNYWDKFQWINVVFYDELKKKLLYE